MPKLRYNLRPEVSNPSGNVVSTMFYKAKSEEEKKKKFAGELRPIPYKKCSIPRPLLSSTFPQGFRISQNFGHPNLGSGGRIGLKI